MLVNWIDEPKAFSIFNSRIQHTLIGIRDVQSLKIVQILPKLLVFDLIKNLSDRKIVEFPHCKVSVRTFFLQFCHRMIGLHPGTNKYGHLTSNKKLFTSKYGLLAQKELPWCDAIVFFYEIKKGTIPSKTWLLLNDTYFCLYDV